MTPDASKTDFAVPDAPSSFNIDTELSKELMKLSFGDRNEMEEEIHGVRCRAVEETPELIRRTMNEFDELLNQKKESDPRKNLLRHVVRISQDQKSDCYLNDPDVRIRFLRCECFRVDKAVERFLAFLKFMSILFGEYVAERPVHRSDFTSKEDKALKNSRGQFLPFRDRSGRRVYTMFGISNYQYGAKLMFKILMYTWWIVSKEVDTQKNGFVFHGYPFNEGNSKHTWDKVIRKNLTMDDVAYRKAAFSAAPMRMVCFHTYYQDTPYFRMLGALAVHTIEPEVRHYTRIHFGSQTEILYKMTGFGVPIHVLPWTSSLVPKFSNHIAWLDAIEKMENMEKQASDSPPREIVDCPKLGDVVFRTGATPKYNPGNSYYRDLIRHHGSDHYSGDTMKKYQITMLVFNAIVKQRNGRFLEWWKEGNTWTVIQDPDVVRKKIAKAFKENSRHNMKPLARKIDETIETALTTLKDDKMEDPVPVSPLEAYYNMAHPSKRPKTAVCFDIAGDKKETNTACFGMAFFPVFAADGTPKQ